MTNAANLAHTVAGPNFRRFAFSSRTNASPGTSPK